MNPHKSTGSILLSPRITEKGALLSEQGAYVFNVSPRANKLEIAKAVEEIYKVKPRQVRVVSILSKIVRTRGINRLGKTTGGKKAYVYLKKGDKIEFM